MKRSMWIITAVFSLLPLGLFSGTALAAPQPQYAALNNVAQFGSYVDKNSKEIIDSSVDLAKIAAPGKHYFLIVKNITINAYGPEIDQGEKPFATLEMFDAELTCSRDVFARVKTDEWGEGRVLTFTLAPTIRCQ